MRIMKPSFVAYTAKNKAFWDAVKKAKSNPEARKRYPGFLHAFGFRLPKDYSP